MVYILEILGVACFAVSGVAASRSKRPDIVGAIILAFATALGGGVIRDAILGVPAESFHDHNYFIAILVGAIAAMQMPAMMQRFGSTLRIADAFGLGLFNAAGTMKALQSGAIDPVFAIVLGAITGAGGGVIRDVLCNEMPSLLRPGELYITTCLVGGVAGLIAYWLGAPLDIAGAVIAAVTIVFRLLSIRFEWRLAALE